MGDGQAPSETLASPLLRQPQEVEEPMSKQRNTPLMDWWLRKWQLMLYTVLLLIASVGNTVFFQTHDQCDAQLRLVLDAVVDNDLRALFRMHGWHWHHATG